MSSDGPGGDGPAPWVGRSLGRTYWRLWISSGLSNLADGIVKVGLPLVAIQLTRSPTLVAGLAVALTLPWLLFALPAGALADRLDRRRVMLGANLVRGALLGSLVSVLLLDSGSIWTLYAVAAGIGVAETLYDTSAQSILPQVVRPEQLSRANARLYAAELTANEFVGPPLAGFLVAAGTSLAVATPAGPWIVAVVALLAVRGRFRVERPEQGTLRADVVEGLHFLWRHRLLRTLAVMTGVFNFAISATLAILVLYAVGPTSAMALSEPEFGLLLATFAAGSLIGSFAAAWVEAALGRSRALVVSILAGTLPLGAPAFTTNPYVIGVVFFLGGVGIVGWNVVTVSLRQRVTPGRLLGRVNSGYRLVAWGTRPLGAAAGGLLAQFLGLRPVFGVMAVLGLVVLVATTTTVGDGDIDAAERAAEEPG